MKTRENCSELNTFIEEISSFLDKDRIIEEAPMDRYTSFRAGGKASVLVVVDDVEELKKLLKIINKTELNCLFLGSGSNILIKDSGFSGIVIKLGEGFNAITVDGDEVRALAGAKLSSVARTALDNSLVGFEFASGIPGSVGGGIFMNAGAYGGELKDIVVSVDVVSCDGERVYTLTGDELEFGYRHSVFHESKDIVLSATFKLTKGNKEEIDLTMRQLMEKRNTKQPVQLPSAGSFFKRPEGHFAGGLIEQAGLKGLSVGNAQVSPLHAGFIVNNGGATATEIIELMHLVQHTVYDKFGVKLEPEVRIIGD